MLMKIILDVIIYYYLLLLLLFLLLHKSCIYRFIADQLTVFIDICLPNSLPSLFFQDSGNRILQENSCSLDHDDDHASSSSVIPSPSPSPNMFDGRQRSPSSRSLVCNDWAAGLLMICPILLLLLLF